MSKYKRLTAGALCMVSLSFLWIWWWRSSACPRDYSVLDIPVSTMGCSDVQALSDKALLIVNRNMQAPKQTKYTTGEYKDVSLSQDYFPRSQCAFDSGAWASAGWYLPTTNRGQLPSQGEKDNQYFGGKDAFIAMQDKSGDLKWIRRFGSSWDDSCEAVTSTSDGGCVAGGFFRDAMTFSTTTGSDIVLQAEPTGHTEDVSEWIAMFLVRYTKDGSVAWANSSTGSPSFSNVVALTSLSDDSIIVLGSAYDADWIYGTGETNLRVASPGLFHYLARFDSEGDVTWVRTVTGLIDDVLFLQGAKDDTVSFAVAYSYPITIGGLAGEQPQEVKGCIGLGSENVMVCRFKASSGSLIWVKSLPLARFPEMPSFDSVDYVCAGGICTGDSIFLLGTFLTSLQLPASIFLPLKARPLWGIHIDLDGRSTWWRIGIAPRGRLMQPLKCTADDTGRLYALLPVYNGGCQMVELRGMAEF